jgi:hypothetical protein
MLGPPRPSERGRGLRLYDRRQPRRRDCCVEQHAADGAAKTDFAGHTRYRDRDERVRVDRNRPVDRQGRSRRAQTEPPPNPEAGTTAETGSPRCSRSAIAEIKLRTRAGSEPSPDAPQPRHHRHAHPERVGSVEHQSTYSGGRGPVDKRAVNRAIILGWQSRSRSATRSRRTRGWQSRRRTELCAGVQLPRGLLYPLDYEFDFITAGGMLIRWN